MSHTRKLEEVLDSFPLCIKFKSHKLMFRSIKCSVNRNQHSFHAFAFVTTWVSYNDVLKKSQSLTFFNTNSQLGLTHQRTLPHSLTSLQRGAPLGHQRTQRQILTWRGGSHLLLVVTEGD